MIRWILLALIVASVVACGSPGEPPEVEIEDDPTDVGCPRMFRQGILPDYHITIADAEWALMEDEFYNRVEREAAGLDVTPYHPVDFRYVAADEEIGDVPGVLFRLKGASSWLQSLDLDENPKMQFVIAFNEVDPNGRFMGVRKIELDMPRTDQTFVHQRVALSYLREAGLPAQCANNARLFINGEYYGLYTNLERLDKEFLQRQYGDQDEGDLWKSGRIIRTNEDTFTWDRLDALWNLTTVAEMRTLADFDAAMQEWAAEAVVGDADGYYNGRANFYLYDHPTRGFVWIPHDVDTAIDWDFLPPDSPPVFPLCVARWERDWHHYILVMNDPVALEEYIAAIRNKRASYDVGAMQDRLDRWSEQIRTAAYEDAHKPFTMDDHGFALMRTRDYMAVRADYIDAWLGCRSGGGTDQDGDGIDMCHDCSDADPTVRPGAVETCNLRDDNCDGRVDSVDGVTVCSM